MILEVAILNVRAGTAAAFESSFAKAAPIIAASPGYVSHELRHCVEITDRYILLVKWQSLLHHYYDPFPTVEHYEPV